MLLSNKHLQDYEKNGFLLLENFYSIEEILEIGKWTNEVASKPEIPGEQMMYFEESLKNPSKRILNRVEYFSHFHKKFNELFSSKLAKVTTQLLKDNAILFKEKINFKYPGGDGFKAHQDQQAGWGKYINFFITVMIAVDESQIENGCIEIAAGQHKNGLIGEEWKPLENDLEYKDFPTKPGDIIFFDSYVPHRSSPNMSNRPRRSIFVTYNRKSDGNPSKRYYKDKRLNYPPDCERDPKKKYVFRV